MGRGIHWLTYLFSPVPRLENDYLSPSEAELESFNKLFGKMPSPFENSKALLSRANAPWNNLLSKEAATMLSNLL